MSELSYGFAIVLLSRISRLELIPYIASDVLLVIVIELAQCFQKWVPPQGFRKEFCSFDNFKLYKALNSHVLTKAKSIVHHIKIPAK